MNSLPGIKNSLVLGGISSYIYQPNHLTEASYNYSLIQERIMNSVIYLLQDSIRLRMMGKDYRQLSLFNNNNNIVLDIPLRLIASKSQYSSVKESCKELAGLVVEIRYTDKCQNEKRLKYTGLFKVDLPEERTRTSFMRLEIDPDVAKILININLNDRQKPINFTKYYFKTAIEASKKYTPRIYKLLCCYRSRGYFEISLLEFKKMLGIEGKYKEYRDLKKYVLKPVQEDLIRMGADCWFDCDDRNFTIREGNTVIGLYFKVITQQNIINDENNRKLIKEMLSKDFKFTRKNLDEIDELIEKEEPLIIIKKLDRLRFIINQKHLTKNKIICPQNYVLKSLISEFYEK